MSDGILPFSFTVGNIFANSIFTHNFCNLLNLECGCKETLVSCIARFFNSVPLFFVGIIGILSSFSHFLMVQKGVSSII